MGLDRDLIPRHPAEVISNLDRLESKITLVPDGVSEFQIRRFIVGSEASEEGRFRQCIVELRSRANSLEKAYIQRERLRLDKQEIERRDVGEDDIEIKRRDLDLLEKDIDLRESERGIARLEGEIEVLSDILQEFKDSELDLDESSYWEQSLRRKVALNMALKQPLSMNLIEAALNMPEDSEIRKWMESTLNLSEGAQSDNG